VRWSGIWSRLGGAPPADFNLSARARLFKRGHGLRRAPAVSPEEGAARRRLRRHDPRRSLRLRRAGCRSARTGAREHRSLRFLANRGGFAYAETLKGAHESFRNRNSSPQIRDTASRAGSPLPPTLTPSGRLRNPVQQAQKQIPGRGLALWSWRESLRRFQGRAGAKASSWQRTRVNSAGATDDHS
jgi:hypothetical protein